MYNQILHGDVLEKLKSLLDETINCVITSPPYYGLRNYGLPPTAWPEITYEPMAGLPPVTIPPMVCCLGQEDSIEAYVGHMVLVFRELWRVLRDDGVAWLNLGDSYAANRNYQVPDSKYCDVGNNHGSSVPNGLKPKDLMGIPWRVAFALQADGWYLRSDVIWSKKNPMPESVTDRPTKAHEYVFLLPKSGKYWFDQDAIREPYKDSSIQRISQAGFDNQTGGEKDYRNGINKNRSMRQTLENFKNTKNTGRNKRTVWSIATKPFSGAKLLPDVSIDHFAVMPEALAEVCLLAGCPPQVCEMCGKPWVKEFKIVGKLPKQKWGKIDKNTGRLYSVGPMDRGGKDQYQTGGIVTGEYLDKRLIGFAPTCQCCPLPDCTTDMFNRRLPIFNAHHPGIALDPFFGAGTVAVVAEKLKRRWLGIELNEDYVAMAKERIARTQPALFAR